MRSSIPVLRRAYHVIIKKKKTISFCSTEAECIAVAGTLKEVLLAWQILGFMRPGVIEKKVLFSGTTPM